jgi:predicted nucleotide-binding protein
MDERNSPSQVIEGLKGLQKSLSGLREKHSINENNITRERLRRWKERAVQYLNLNVSSKEAEEFKGHLKDPEVYLSIEDLGREIALYDSLLQVIIDEIEVNPYIIDSAVQAWRIASEADKVVSEERTLRDMPSETGAVLSAEACVFIGHGRSPLWARLQLFLENDLGLKTVNYESESRVGDSIVPVLEKMLEQATFAVLILTAEDETAVGSKRARQNVIHEAGLFQGRLGFKRAVLLRQDGIEEFSNVAGLQYISFVDDKIEQTFYDLQRVLKREGLI